MRQFTCMADQKSQLLTLSIDDLNRMKMEFYDSFEELFNESMGSVDIALKLKLREIRRCQIIQDEYRNNPDVRKFLELEE